MNLWIDIARDDLVKVIERVDCVILNDAELRQLTEKPNLVSAAREVLTWGPSVVVAKQGEYGAALVTPTGFFALPAYPLETVVDPTGAGDSFAGGFVGWLAQNTAGSPTDEALRLAMAYGTAIASYNVEELGTDRVARLTRRRGQRARGRHPGAHARSRWRSLSRAFADAEAAAGRLSVASPGARSSARRPRRGSPRAACAGCC